MNKSSSSVRRRAESIPIECLRSSAYDVVEFYKNHEAVGAALGLDLRATIALAKALPLGLRHSEHRAMRAELAKVLAEGKAKLTPRLPELVKSHFEVLDAPGRHDLLNGVCKPFINDCMALLSGASIDISQFDNLSDIFDPAIGYSKRKRLEANTQQLLEETKLKSSATYELAVAVMGRDALLGSLVFSLYNHFREIQGRTINARAFSPVPTDTGVPYIWRVGVEPETNGVTYECHLGQLVGADDSERLKLFGLGAHTCLGKTHSLKIFESISENLSMKDRTVMCVTVSAVEKHVLKLPEAFEIELE